MLIAFMVPQLVYGRDVEAHGPAIGRRQHPHLGLRA